MARRLLQVEPDSSVVLLEKERELAQHQTGRNSGVVHAGLYYEPGSLKATLCRRGGALLREYCQEHGIAYDAVGKVVVATRAAEVPGLDRIEQRARANGVPDLARVGPEGLSALEPHVVGVAALHSPHTATVDFRGVCRRLNIGTVCQCHAGDARRVPGGLRRKGRIVAGYDADFCLVDPSATWTVHAELSESTQEYTPFEGFELGARVTDTWVRGHRVLEDGVVTGAPVGRYLHRPGSR